MELITCVIPAFNPSDAIIEAVESVLSCNPPPNEVIVVNDGSDPNYEGLFGYLSGISEKIKIINLQKNVGIGAALNIGLKNASGAYIMRMDSDDICMPDRIEKFQNVIQSEPKVDVVGFGARFRLEAKEQNVFYPPNHEEIVETIKLRNPINHPTVFFNKNRVLSIGGYSENDAYGCEDWDLWLRGIDAGFQFRNIQSVGIIYDYPQSARSLAKAWPRLLSVLRLRKKHSLPLMQAVLAIVSCVKGVLKR